MRQRMTFFRTVFILLPVYLQKSKSLKSEITIGTRGSKLALWQAHFVKDELAAIGITAHLEIIKTKGDRIQDLSFDKIEGKGFFTKEIEEALLASQIDMAVHSMKDLPTSSPPGLKIAGLSKRANPADWLIIRSMAIDSTKLFKLKEKAIIGTSSVRRKTQMLHFRPDITLKDIRGNVPTRIRKLEEGTFDGIILAAAGLERLDLDLTAYKVIKFNPQEFVPAPAQGVLAYQIRSEDADMQQIVRKIHHPDVAETVGVERKVLQLLDGGCQLPLGVYCQKDQHENFHVFAAMGNQEFNPLKKIKVSYSTKAGLAEHIIDQLK